MDFIMILDKKQINYKSAHHLLEIRKEIQYQRTKNKKYKANTVIKKIAVS
jgi:hypothetical protein